MVEKYLISADTGTRPEAQSYKELRYCALIQTKPQTVVLDFHKGVVIAIMMTNTEASDDPTLLSLHAANKSGTNTQKKGRDQHAALVYTFLLIVPSQSQRRKRTSDAFN